MGLIKIKWPIKFFQNILVMSHHCLIVVYYRPIKERRKSTGVLETRAICITTWNQILIKPFKSINTGPNYISVDSHVVSNSIS